MKNKALIKETLLNQLKTQIDSMYSSIEKKHENVVLDPNDTHDPEDFSQQDESSIMEDLFQQKINDKRREYDLFLSIDFGPKESIMPGAIVKTQRTTFVIGIATLPYDWDGERWMGISTKSPLYQHMHDKKIGDKFEFLNQEFEILTIY